MKHFLITAFILTYAVGFAQNKWNTAIELDFVFPNKKSYFYNTETYRINDVELENSGFLLTSFGVQGSYNYFILKKLSIGVVSGFQTQSKPSYAMIKLGGVLKYYFVDRNNIYFYLQVAHNFSLNTEQFNYGNNTRLGLGFPIIKREGYNIVSNIFFEQNLFQLDGTKPLLGGEDEKPRTLNVHSFGISFGVNF